MVLFLSKLFYAALLLCIVTSTANTYQPNFEQQVLGVSSDVSHEPYKAPLRDCDGSLGDVIKGMYTVLLFPGYSFEDHRHNIGKNIDKYVVAVLQYVYQPSIGYGCKNVEDELLDDIRADTGVKEIFCEPKNGPRLERPVRNGMG